LISNEENTMGKLVALPSQDDGAWTVAEATDHFLARDWSNNTRRNYASDLRRFTEAFAERRVDTLTCTDLQTYIDGMKTRRGAVRQSVSPQTRNRHHGTLQNLFGWLVRIEELSQNPMNRVERRRLGERLPRPMSRQQVQTLFARIDQLRDKALFSFLYGSGLRVAEALGLNIDDLDLEDGTFRIVGKGDRERVGYVAESTSKLLRRYLRERDRPRQGPVFVSRHGNRLSYAMAWRLFRRYSEGLEKGAQVLTIHQLRHTFGSERAGHMDALILRDLMGHQSLRTTQQYAKVNPEATKSAFRSFDRAAKR
jgi:site-specific recombinase XerD